MNKAQSIFMYSRRNMEETAGVVFLRNAGEVTPGTQCSALVLSNSRSMWRKQSATNVSSLEHTAWKVQGIWKSLVWVRWVKEGVMTDCNYFKRSYNSQTKFNGHELWLGRFKLDIRKVGESPLLQWENFIILEQEESYSWIRETMESPTLEIFQMFLSSHCWPDIALATFMLWEEGWLDDP